MAISLEDLETLGERCGGRYPSVSNASGAKLLMEIGRHCASLPDFDTRTPDEILGYDEYGVPR